MTVTWKDDDAAKHFVAHRRHIPLIEHMYEAAVRLIGDLGQTPRHIVDLGCGSGVTGGAMRQLWPHAKLTLVDYSPPMLELAQQHYGQEPGVTIIDADLAEPGVMQHIVDQPVDVIVSAAAIHHLQRDRQRELYQEIFDALMPGGVFVNIEHTASVSPRIEAIWWRWFYEKMAQSRTAAGDPVTWQQVRDETEARQELNILSQAHVLVSWLEQIGFEHADCIFKVYEMAVIGGFKPQ